MVDSARPTVFNGVDIDARDYFSKRLSAMKMERESFDPHYKELQQFIKPRRGRFFSQDRNKGEKKHQSIINSKATQSHQIARAGMYAGIMSPARPWLKLRTFNRDLMEFGPVKLWLEQVEKLMLQIFNSGNLYNMAPVMIGELLLFGTGCMLHEDDFEDVARFYTLTAGSYWISQNARYEVDTLAREFEMTAGQMLERFEMDKLSISVQNEIKTGKLDGWHKIVHFIEPNPHHDPDRSILPSYKKFRSKYYDPGDVAKTFLSQSGFDMFPAYCPRWDVTGEDIYGTDCPAMTALGDIKGLQIEEKRKGQAIDKMVNPPLSGPSALRNVNVSSLPGGLTIYSGNPNQRLSPIYQVNPNLLDLREDMAQVEMRIDKAFFVDMFLAISNMAGIQPKNQLELSQRDRERLLQLGPTLQRFHGEFLEKLVDRTFFQMDKARILPELPEELDGQPLEVEFISSLASAQKQVATEGIERTMAFAAGLMQSGFPEVRHKIDAMQVLDEFSNAVGAPTKMVLPDDIAQESLQAEQQAIAAQQQEEKALAATEAIKNVSNSPTQGGESSVLDDAGASLQ